MNDNRIKETTVSYEDPYWHIENKRTEHYDSITFKIKALNEIKERFEFVCIFRNKHDPIFQIRVQPQITEGIKTSPLNLKVLYICQNHFLNLFPGEKLNLESKSIKEICEEIMIKSKRHDYDFYIMDSYYQPNLLLINHPYEPNFLNTNFIHSTITFIKHLAAFDEQIDSVILNFTKITDIHKIEEYMKLFSDLYEDRECTLSLLPKKVFKSIITFFIHDDENLFILNDDEKRKYSDQYFTKFIK